MASGREDRIGAGYGVEALRVSDYTKRLAGLPLKASLIVVPPLAGGLVLADAGGDATHPDRRWIGKTRVFAGVDCESERHIKATLGSKRKLMAGFELDNGRFQSAIAPAIDLMDPELRFLEAE